VNRPEVTIICVLSLASRLISAHSDERDDESVVCVCVCVCVFVCLQECDQVHIDDVSSDDNGQDLRSDNTRSLCRAMPTNTQADLRGGGDKEVMPPKFAPLP